MVNCAPLLVCLFLFIAQEPTVYYNEMLDISVSSTAIMNTVLLICIAIVLALYGWVKFELDAIEQALFPKIVLDKETHLRQSYD